MDFDKDYFEKFGGLRRSEIALFEKYAPQLDYLGSFLFCPCSGEGLHYLHSLGKKTYGVDRNKTLVDRFPIPGLMRVGDARDLSIPNKSFECVVSLDLLEHLAPTEIVKTVEGFADIARFAIVIAICSKDFKWVYNDPTHQTIWSLQTWKELLEVTLGTKDFKLVEFCPNEELFIFKYFKEG